MISRIPSTPLLILLAAASSAVGPPRASGWRYGGQAGRSREGPHPDAPEDRPSVVYVAGGNERGTGVCIDKEGIILTSPTACGTTTDTATVIVPGGKQYTGRVIGRDTDKELALLKIDLAIPAVEFADSSRVKPGQIAYVFGDCFDSIVNDDQVAMSYGAVSSIYDLTKRQRGTFYTGT